MNGKLKLLSPGYSLAVLRGAFAVLVLLVGAVAAQASEDSNTAWMSFQEGRRLYEQKRFGEALDAFKTAAQIRDAQFSEALGRIDAVLSDREAPKAKDSLTAFIDILAKRDLIARDVAAIDARAGGSLAVEIRLLRERRLSYGLLGLLDAVDLVLSQRGASRVGDSIAALRAAALGLRSYPEAQFWIGKVYLAEGETRLAELQFNQAYEERAFLEVPDDGFTILEALAEVYRDQDRMKDYETALRQIADASELFSAKDEYLRGAMELTLSRDGFDEFMILYRFDEAFPRKAFSRLGDFYLENGRPHAVIYFAAAVNIALTKAIAVIKEDDPEFTYKDLADLAARISTDRGLTAYARETGLYRDLVLLGEALAAGGYRDSARGIWRAVVAIKGIDPWNRRAGEALARKSGVPLPYPAILNTTN